MAEPATLPPLGLPGLNPEWSRLVTAPDHRGVDTTWHLLDTEPAHARVTLLCVHGNPSWSYLWRELCEQAPSDVRVIAVDQLDMGFSERTDTSRRLADRIDDLTNLTQSLELRGPVLTVAHDWGGPISIGWALRHREQLAGIVLSNTAVHQPPQSPAPRLIRAIRRRGVLRTSTVDTKAFVRGASALSRPRLAKDVAAAFEAPYATKNRRRAVGDFVEDIPLDDGHPSSETLNGIAEGTRTLSDIPALLLWGPRDPVFSDLYLHDLEERLPHAHVHRFAGASHFVPEDSDAAGTIFDWLGAPPLGIHRPQQSTTPTSVPQTIDVVRDHDSPAIVELDGDDQHTLTFSELAHRIDQTAASLSDAGVSSGERVAVMVPPGIDLTLVVYACWRLGAVVVLVDAGLGPRNMSRAMSSAAPTHLVGIRKALAASRTLRWPGQRIAADSIVNPEQQPSATLPDMPAPNADAAIVFTSGSTGPSKGVRYTHGQIIAQRDAIAALYEITATDRLVAAFAPFALYGPMLGIPSVVPDMDVTKPATLTATSLAEAVRAIDATMIFASPTALSSVADSAEGLSPDAVSALAQVRLVLSAGAPVSDDVLERSHGVIPNASIHTPYGMTECLPVADISYEERRRVGSGSGVCVGFPLPAVQVQIAPLDELGISGEPSLATGVDGEIVIQAPHMKSSYDRLWRTEHQASSPRGWHRTGDVGRLDESGRLWVGGRTTHVVSTSSGPVLPVVVEHAVQDIPAVSLAAAVGVGPLGTQALIVVVEANDNSNGHLASMALADQVRAAVRTRTNTDIAAVLVMSALPVDSRHNAKIDRTSVAEWAGQVLSGGRVSRT